jgi:hypothetical protein
VGFKGAVISSLEAAAMFAYKFATACAGAILGITVAVALAHPSAETNDGKFFKAAKLDVLGSQPDVECPKIAWPYGCEWHPRVASRTKHAQRRRHLYSLFD